MMNPGWGLAGVDAIIGLNSMVGVGGPIKCVQIIKILKANVIFQIFNVILSDTIILNSYTWSYNN